LLRCVSGLGFPFILPDPDAITFQWTVCRTPA
jgi:hypothetical protein